MELGVWMLGVCLQVMVASGQKNQLEQRMKVCTLLWDAGIKVTYIHTPITIKGHFVYKG